MIIIWTNSCSPRAVHMSEKDSINSLLKNSRRTEDKTVVMYRQRDHVGEGILGQ